MFARITRFKIKPGSIDAATTQVNAMKDQIMALEGLSQFINVMNPDGSGYIVSIVSDKATSDANAEKVKAIWATMGDHLEEAPSAEGFDVLAVWSN